MVCFFKVYDIDQENNEYKIELLTEKSEFLFFDFSKFFEHIKKYLPPKSKLYCDNLKIEGSRMLYYMQKNDYKESTVRNEKKMKNKEYTTLLTTEKWYQIKMKLGKKIIFFESFQNYTNAPLQRVKKQMKMEDKNDIKAMKEIYDKSFKDFSKITIGSQALYNYKTMIGNKAFETLFPVLNDKDYDNICRAVRGGINYLKKENIKTGKIYRFDEVSAYPSICCSDRLLPFGTPILRSGKFTADSKYKLAIIHVHCKMSRKEDRLPSFSYIPLFDILNDETLTEYNTDEIADVWITSVDREIIENDYDIEYWDEIEHYAFRADHAYKFFRNYMIKYYTDKKNASNQFEKLTAKMLLNSLIGQFAKRKSGKLIKYNYENIEKYESKIKTVYPPLTAFITAYARKILSDMIDYVDIEDVVMTDTDSLHTLIDISNFLKIGKDLGCWQLEAEAEEGIFIKRKTYAEKVENKWEIKAAGINDETTENIDIKDFKKGEFIETENLLLKGGIYKKEKVVIEL